MAEHIFVEYITCPHCNTWHAQYHVAITHKKGKEEWTDGSANLPDKPFLIAECTQCKKRFWIPDATVVQEADINTNELKDKKYRDAPEIEHPESFYFFFNVHSDKANATRIVREIMRFYEELIHSDFAKTTEQKAYLHLMLWWKINDLVRFPIDPSSIAFRKMKRLQRFFGLDYCFKKRKKMYRENLKKYAPYLDELMKLLEEMKSYFETHSIENENNTTITDTTSDELARYYKQDYFFNYMFPPELFQAELYRMKGEFDTARDLALHVGQKYENHADRALKIAQLAKKHNPEIKVLK